MYRKIFRLLLLALLVALVWAPTACKKKETPPASQPARVSATGAYEKFFGPTPTTDKGSCYAFVIYFPSAKEPGKVLPFPFFTFDKGSIKKVAVERLISGLEVPVYKDEILQPFALGAHLLKLSEHEGLVTVDFGKDFLGTGNSKDGMLNAIVLTLAQFEGVNGVKLLSEGEEIDFARGTLLPVASAALHPSPPRLLSVTATKDKGAKEVEEVNAYFDRPVEIKEITISDKDGRPFKGDVYLSVFDMAAVLKPKDASVFTAGMPVKVRWRVADKLGRQAEGESELSLEIKEH